MYVSCEIRNELTYRIPPMAIVALSHENALSVIIQEYYFVWALHTVFYFDTQFRILHVNNFDVSSSV